MNDQLESWKIALDLALRDYEHTENAWPTTLREKGFALIQLYTISIGILPIYLTDVYRYALHFGKLGFSGDFTRGSLAMVMCIASIIVFMVACYYIRNVLLLKLRNTFDSREMIKLLEKKEVPPEELCISAAQSLRGYIDENVSAWSELSREIRRSYRLYYVALFASIVL